MVSVSSTVSTPMSGLKVCIIPHFVTPPFSDILEDQLLEPNELPNIKTGSLQQFIQNAESKRARKVLRVIHAPSDFIQQLPFTTDYLVWHETRSLPYWNTRLLVPCNGTITTMLMLYKSGHSFLMALAFIWKSAQAANGSLSGVLLSFHLIPTILQRGISFFLNFCRCEW